MTCPRIPSESLAKLGLELGDLSSQGWGCGRPTQSESGCFSKSVTVERKCIPARLTGVTFFFPRQHFLLEISKHIEKLKEWYSEHFIPTPSCVQLTSYCIPFVTYLSILVPPIGLKSFLNKFSSLKTSPRGNIQPLHTSGPWSSWTPLLAFLVLFLISGACGQGTWAKVSEQTAWLFQAVPSYSVPQSADGLMSGSPSSRHCPL